MPNFQLKPVKNIYVELWLTQKHQNEYYQLSEIPISGAFHLAVADGLRLHLVGFVLAILLVI